MRVLLRESALVQRIQEAVEVLVEVFNLEELAHAHDLVEDKLKLLLRGASQGFKQLV